MTAFDEDLSGESSGQVSVDYEVPTSGPRPKRLRKTTPMVWPGVPRKGDDVVVTRSGGTTLRVDHVRWDRRTIVLVMESLDPGDDPAAIDDLVSDGFEWFG